VRHEGAEPLTWTADVAAASWIAGRLHPFGMDVGSIVPVGFEAYARIFHPVIAPEGRLRWSEVARRNRRIAHAEMQFHMIARPAGHPDPDPSHYNRGDGPAWGYLPIEERSVLVEVLRRATTTPDRCWFLVWEGYGGLDDRGVTARVRLPHRNYLLAYGPIESALSPFPRKSSPSLRRLQSSATPDTRRRLLTRTLSRRRFLNTRTIELPVDLATLESPNLWWPEDQAWIVATEIDFAWTYLGGSASLIETVIAEPRLEALRARPTDKPFYNSDVANAALD
jgi:hypothetical protein